MKKFNWGLFVAISAVAISWFLLAVALCGCVQHELNYEYYLEEDDSTHVEKFHYKQNTLAMKTDKKLVDAAFADIISVKMERSTQVPDPNTAKAVTEGIVEGVVGVVK